MKIENDTEIYVPNECYFGIDESEDYPTTVLIVNKDYWDKNQCTNESIGDQSFESTIIPNDFYNVMEATWETQMPMEKAKLILEKSGFTFNKSLSEFVADYV